MELIKATIDANYNDREIEGNSVETNMEDALPGRIWFNVNLSNKREDDYITVSMKIEDLMMAIGKLLSKKEED